MNELITCVFSLRPICSNLLLSHCHTSKTPLGRMLQNVLHYRLFQDCHRVPNQPINRQKVSLQLFVLKLVLLASEGFLMSFVPPLPGLTFIFHPTIALPACFFLCLCYPSSLSSPTLASSCLYLCSGLKQRSLNHIRNGSFATCHPLN